MAKRQIAGTDARISNLTFGLVLGEAIERRFAQCIGKDLVDAWSGLVGDEQSSYFRVERPK
jgi:hypothetical protein